MIIWVLIIIQMSHRDAMIEEGEIEMEEKVENSHKMEDVPKAEDKHKME